MSILKNILGAFVEFTDDGNTKKTDTPLPSENEVPKPVSNSTIASPPAPSVSTQNTAQAYSKHFNDVMEEANANNPLFKGTDFKEFIDSKEDLDAITDEPTKYRTAFNVLKRTGLTKDRLVSTGQEYIKVIQRDLDAFENAYARQYKADVENKEALLQQKAEELQALTDKINTLTKEREQLSVQVAQNKERLGANRVSFLQSGEAKKKEIKIELEKIEQYF